MVKSRMIGQPAEGDSCMDVGVSTRVVEEILIVTIDRPKANAISAATSAALFEAFEELANREELRVGIVTGAGERFFSAGWDLKAAAEGEAHDADQGRGGFAGLTEYFDLSKPVIAAVNGSAYGGGVELMLACHMAVAAKSAVFAFPEAGLGIVPDAGGLTRLPATLPRAVAYELLLTGRQFTAAEAYRWGLVNRAVPSESVLSEAIALAREVCRAAPLSVRAVIEAVSAGQGLGERESFARVAQIGAVAQALHSEDAREGARAFSERREPRWRNG